MTLKSNESQQNLTIGHYWIKSFFTREPVNLFVLGLILDEVNRKLLL